MSGCSTRPADVSANLGQEFSLSTGQRALVAGEGLEIEFEKVVEDSRCPRDVTCIRAGRVSCIVGITQGDSSYDMVLTEPGLNDQYVYEVYEEYQLAFRVEPHPEADKKISDDEYRLLLIISR